MTSGGHEVDVGGEGSALRYMNNVLDFIIERSIARQDSRCCLTGKKLALGFIAPVLLIGNRPPSPYVQLAST